MWRIAKKLTGKQAYSGASKHISGDVNISRFACWIVRNDKLGAEIPLYMYLPYEPENCSKLIFSIHGYKRNARKYRNIFVDSLQNQNVLLVAPEFRGGPFSSSLALTMGNMLARLRSSEPLPSELWTFPALDEVYRLLANEFKNIKTFSIFGHSAGAQFAYRYMLFTENTDVKSAVAANPGWLTVLDPDVRFPYGVKNKFNDEQLRQILAKPIVLMAGEADTKVDEKVRMSKRARAQGANRFERTNFAYHRARALAENLDTPCNWRLVTVPGLSHSAKRAAPAALPYLL